MTIAGNIHKIKILIVEDNVIFRQAFRERLQNQFPSVVVEEASEGNEALQKVDTFHPELIFMDIRLPGENGLDLTRKIMVSHPETVVIILTDYDIPEYRKAASQCGASHFFVKESLDWGQVDTVIRSHVSMTDVRS
jgi:DNA-binding NarL/FixJ family response regulator